MVNINTNSPVPRTSGAQGSSGTETTGKATGPEAKSGVSGGSGVVPSAGNGSTGGTQNVQTGFSPTSQAQGGSQTETRMQIAADKLSDPNLSIDEKIEALLSAVRDPDILSKLMIEFAQMGRDNALDNRLNARAQARSDLEGQADQTREAAAKQLATAIVSLVVAVVSFVVSAIGVGAAGKETSKSTKAGLQSVESGRQANQAGMQAQNASKVARGAGEGTEIGDAMGNVAATKGFQKTANELDAKEFSVISDAASQKAQMINSITPALSGLINAIGGTLSGIMDYSAKMDEAEGQDLAAKATDEQANADLAKKFMEDLEEMVKSALQFIKEMNNAETDMMANMTRV